MQAPPAKEAPQREPGLYLMGALLVAAAIALTLLLATFLPQPLPKARASARPTVTSESAAPRVIAESFLAQLRLEGYPGAHALLSQTLRERTELVVFQRRIQAWTAEENVRWDLRYRKAGSETITGDTAWVRVQSASPELPTWTWTLIKEPSGWKLDSLEGVPLVRPG